MIKEVRRFFFKPGTTEVHKEKVISAIVLTIILICLVMYGKHKNEKLTSERVANKHYTIGFTKEQRRNFRLPNPFVVYSFNFNDKIFEKDEDIPDYLEGKVIVKGGRYYVQFSFEQPDNCILLLEYPVPDSVKEAPAEGWDYMPGYEHNK